MFKRLLLLAMCGGCTPSVESDRISPPPTLVMPVWADAVPSSITVEGLPRRVQVHLAYGEQSGSGPCAPSGSPCLDVPNPTRVSTTTSRTGRATFTITPALDSTELTLQPFMEFGGTWRVGPVATVTVEDREVFDRDGDD